MKKYNRTLLVALLIVAVFATAIGGTFAWFTDVETSGENVIQSGNLDIVVEYAKGVNDEWAPLTKDTKIFDESALYEPGYTETVFFRISNAGNLALKYKVGLSIYDSVIGKSVEGNEIKLSDYLQIGALTTIEKNFGINMWQYTKPQFEDREAALNAVSIPNNDSVTGLIDLSTMDENGILMLGNGNSYLYPLPDERNANIMALVLHMPTTVGNEANHVTGTVAPQIKIGLNVVATQYTHEDDSFDNQYDADATYPGMESLNGLPKADVKAEFDVTMPFVEVDLSSGSYVLGEEKEYKLETLLTFTALDTAETLVDNPYRYWNGDFTVSVDKPVPADVIGLAGKYDPFAFAFDVNSGLCNLIEEGSTTIPANTDFRLLAPFGFFVNYEEICTSVKEFICGVYFTENATEEQKKAIEGTTMTVTLNIYETIDPSLNNGKPSPEEVIPENVIPVGVYKYTF